MALYMMQVKPLSRGKGQSATAAAAYRSGTLIACQREGRTHDYSRKSGILKTQSQIILPVGIEADWLIDRNALWNAAEAAEKRKDARVAREYIVALPHEATAKERQQLAVELSQYLANSYGIGVDLNIHAPHRHKGTENNNHHAHILTTTRMVTPHGFGQKSDIELCNTDRATRNLCSSADELKRIRAHWAELQNTVLAKYGIQVSALSLQDQGINREPTLHLGPQATALERMGIATEIGNINRAIEKDNADRALRCTELDQQIMISNQLIDKLQTHRRNLQSHERSQAIVRAHRAAVDTANAVSHTASSIGRTTDQHESTLAAVSRAAGQHGSTIAAVSRTIHTTLDTCDAIADYLDAYQNAAAAHTVNRAITATTQLHRDIVDSVTHLTNDVERCAKQLGSMSHTTDLWSGWCREQVESIDARVAADKKKHLIETTLQAFIKSQDIYADYMRRYNLLVHQHQNEQDLLSAKVKISDKNLRQYGMQDIGGKRVQDKKTKELYQPPSDSYLRCHFEEDCNKIWMRFDEALMTLFKDGHMDRHIQNMHRLKKILDDNDTHLPLKNRSFMDNFTKNTVNDYLTIDSYMDYVKPRLVDVEAKATEKARLKALERAQEEAKKQANANLLRQLTEERLERQQQRLVLEQEKLSVQQHSQPESVPTPTTQISNPARKEQKKDDRHDFDMGW